MIREAIKSIPGVRSFIKTNTWKYFRHSITLFTSERQNATFTLFLRLPSQYDALSGPILDFLLNDRAENNLKIAVIGCSNGAEPYSIASVLQNRQSELKFRLHAFDIDKDVIGKAQSGQYTREEVYNNSLITASFVDKTFDIDGNRYSVKQAIKEAVHFDIADALDVNLRNVIGKWDIVYAQNFLFHLKHRIACKAFNNICTLLNDKAALFVDGMDLDIRQKLTRKNNLVPLEFKIEEIHNEARLRKGNGWPFNYWGLEPFAPKKRDWKRRYSTIFLKIPS